MKKLTTLTLAIAVVAAMSSTSFAGSCGSGSHSHDKKTDATTAAAVSKSYDKSGDIVETAIAAENFTTLVAAVKAAGLVEALKGDGPFTVFAPTDEAFAALPEGTVEGLLKDTEKLTAILTYHVVPGIVKAEDVVKVDKAETLQGQSVMVKVSDDKVMIDNANVIKTDIMASNGVIHVIDAVIMPDLNK